MSSFMTTNPKELTGGLLRMTLENPVASFLLRSTSFGSDGVDDGDVDDSRKNFDV